MRDFQAEYDRITRIGRRLHDANGPVPMDVLIILDIVQQIIRLESRLAGREVR